MFIQVVTVTILVLFSISKAVVGQDDLLSTFQPKDLDLTHKEDFLIKMIFLIFFLDKAATQPSGVFLLVQSKSHDLYPYL